MNPADTAPASGNCNLHLNHAEIRHDLKEVDQAPKLTKWVRFAKMLLSFVCCATLFPKHVLRHDPGKGVRHKWVRFAKICEGASRDEIPVR